MCYKYRLNSSDHPQVVNVVSATTAVGLVCFGREATINRIKFYEI